MLNRQVLVPRAIKPRDHGWRKPVGDIVRLAGHTMGTTWSVLLVAPTEPKAGAFHQAIEHELDQVVAQMSTWQASSSIGAFNVLPAGSWLEIENEFWTVLLAALDAARKSGGAYDPTIGEIVDLWGFGPAGPGTQEPSAEQLAAAVARAGWFRLELDATTRRVRQPGGVRLDLSSIAKGFGVDQVARRLLSLGCANFLVEVGGELRGEGCKPDGSPWWVLLEQPSADEGLGDSEVPEALIALHGLAIATSGDYRRRLQLGGKWHSHTIDPRTGMPVANGVASVTVVAADCMTADAWATALMPMGVEAGLACAVRHDVNARFVFTENGILQQRMSPELVAMLG